LSPATPTNLHNPGEAVNGCNQEIQKQAGEQRDTFLVLLQPGDDKYSKYLQRNAEGGSESPLASLEVAGTLQHLALPSVPTEIGSKERS
jgi:hypothetical protein